MNDGEQPATKADLKSAVTELRDELLGAIHDSETRVRDELLEAIHNSETRLLKAFYGFAEGTQLRFREIDQTEASLKERMTVIERRLTDVEKRLNMPPAA